MGKKAAIIGNFEFVLESIPILQRHGFEVAYLFSQTEEVIKKAASKGVRIIASLKDFFNQLQQEPIDYLFSIQNPFIIPDQALKAVKKLAINYHNAPLPRYGGLNAPSWALWFGETEYGVTWHIINELIDGGEILTQSLFLIDKNETAFSLELKCQEYAKKTLEDLALQLASENLSPKKQSLDKRLYFNLYNRPCGLAIINWNDPAEKIWRQFRALHFGTRPNPIGLLKFKLKDQWYVVLNMRLLDTQTEGVPKGSIIHKENNTLQITTSSQDILITSYTPLSPNLSPAFEIEKGDTLEHFSFSEETQKEIAKETAKAEAYWLKNLVNFEPSKNFILKQQAIKTNPHYQKIFTVKFSELSLKQKLTLFDVLTLLCAYLYKINNYEKCSVGLHQSHLYDTKPLMQGLLSPLKPLDINFSELKGFSAASKEITELFKSDKLKSILSNDLFLRYKNESEPFFLNTLTIVFGSDQRSTFNVHCPIIINIDEENETLSLLIESTYYCEYPYFLNFTPHHLKTLTRRWIEQHKPLSEINLLSKKETKLLKQWNNTATLYPKNMSLPSLLDNACKKFSKRIAFENGTQKLNYSELKQRSDNIAKNLFGSIKDQDNQIAIFLDKSIDTITAMLGVLKAGLGYMILDTSYPDHYIKNIISTSKTRLFIGTENTNSRLIKILSKKDHPEIACWDIRELLSTKPRKSLKLPKINPESLAYTIFTSGTTGTPKGVMVSHTSVINLALGVINRLKLSKTDRILQFSTLTFDASVWEIYSSLFAGSTVYVPTSIETLPGNNLKKTIISKKISTLMLPPSVLKVQPYFESLSLKTIIVAGEACPPQIPERWGKYYKIINGYGPTECTVFSTLSTPLLPGKEVIIGSPLQNYKIVICDRYYQPAVLGAIGEVLIMGQGVSLGYINNPELTHKFFKNLKFSGKMYKTYLSGDLGSWTTQGEIKYLGRNDSQVKIRGFRIETKMIESALLNYPGIKNCAVIAAKTPKGDLNLNAYLSLEEKLSINLRSLRIFLKKILPTFMIPSQFSIIENLPLNSSGKINYKKLLNEQKDIEILADDVKHFPETKTQKEIALLWQEIIGFKHGIDIYTDFSELGGSSLQITEMLLSIEKLYGVQVSTSDFLTHPNIKYLETLILMTEKKDLPSISHLILEDLKEFKTFLSTNRLETRRKQAYPQKIKKVLITGITGFLGSYVAKAFLKENIKIYALARANEKDAATRTKEILKTHGWNKNQIAKVHVLQGDLRKRFFDLEPSLYKKLTKEIDAVCNTAAFVHHLFNYSQLRSANVQGVWNCIEFINTNKLKYFSHISTLSLLTGLKENTKQEDFIEFSDLSPLTDKISGYNASKLSAEICLTEALKSLNSFIKIYRPGWIGASSTFEFFPLEKNHLFLFIKGCLQLGYAPDWNTAIDIMPVDYIAEFIAKDTLTQPNSNNIYNMTASNSHSIPFKKMISYFSTQLKKEIKFIPYEVWQNTLKTLTPHNALYPLISLYLDPENKSPVMKAYDFMTKIDHNSFSKNYKKLGLHNPPEGEKMLSQYLKYLLSKGFI